MGRKSLKKVRKEDSRKKEDWVREISPYLHQNGLKGLTMDVVAQQLNISKATVYEYFRSKEELLQLAVSLKLADISAYQAVLANQELDFLERYHRVMQHLSMHIAGISTFYLADLKQQFPKLWKSIENFLEEAVGHLQAFYVSGIKTGAFNNIHPFILTESDRFFFNAITNPKFLEQETISLKDALEQYLQLKFFGLVKKS